MISAAGWKAGWCGTPNSMAVTSDIVESWRHPRRVVARHLARERSEAFVFTFLFVFLLLTFVSLWPGQAREAFAAQGQPLSPRLLAVGLALLATIPLWYGLAALSHLVAKALGGQGNYYRARLALFWALVVVSPLLLLQGMVAGLIGPGPQLILVQIVVSIGFIGIWLVMLMEAERKA